MLDDKFKEAKEMYCFYNGNKFFMYQDEDSNRKKYESFMIPEELEKQWDKEIKADLLNKIENEKNLDIKRVYFSYLNDLSLKMKDIEGIIYLKNLLYRKELNFDSFTKILLIEIIFRWAEYFAKIDKEKMLQIMKESIDSLVKLEEEPITVSKDYFAASDLPDYLTNTELKKRINNDKHKYILLYSQIK